MNLSNVWVKTATGAATRERPFCVLGALARALVVRCAHELLACDCECCRCCTVHCEVVVGMPDPTADHRLCHRVYTRFIEIGRVVLVLEGEFKNKVRRIVETQTQCVDCPTDHSFVAVGWLFRSLS